ncbi:MAG: hypothetical protein ACI9O4_002406 [Chitinophagales bacterium]|jgi:hypothetical protein
MRKEQHLLLLTVPFTQLNTPYPATMYLKGFLNTIHVSSFQADLGIEVILALFTKEGLRNIFEIVENGEFKVSDNTYRIHQLKEDYIQTIDAVIHFLQNKNSTLAHLICDRSFLPEAGRFENLEDLQWTFGTMGIQDKARHLATLYLEDLGDFIKETIDPHFGFSRYAERLGRTASSFDSIQGHLESEDSYITTLLLKLLDEKIQQSKPSLVCLSVPFPGNLFASLKCGQYIKKHYPAIKIVLGGGYANTELRSISDPRVFDYIDFIALDDGEKPLTSLIEYLNDQRQVEDLKRIFLRQNGKVEFFNSSKETDIAQKDLGTPDYADLHLDNYLSVIELANPMHRMWSDGRWNKLTLAHGCYWGKCTFCDVSLDYIKRYEPLTAALICDRIETIIEQTGQNGFHFVDEAAPPNLLRELALEILRRNLKVSWWTNIRFEKHFTPDLAYLLKASGCIAIAGGLEVASDRLLQLMKKGVTVEKVAQVANSLTQAGIMVHAYLMYGFPTETEQETIDALEMVRQLFENEVIQSGFWHQFAMTSHSPVGLNPSAYEVVKLGPKFEGFADNDLYHDDPKGAEHAIFSEGLKTSLFNYMNGLGLDENLALWFKFKIPKTTIPKDFILKSLKPKAEGYRHNISVVWIGNTPEMISMDNNEMSVLEFYSKSNSFALDLDPTLATWLLHVLESCSFQQSDRLTFEAFKVSYREEIHDDFDPFWQSETIEILRSNGLLVL